MPQLVYFENTGRFHQSVDNLMHITAIIVDVGCQNHLVMSVCNLFEPLLEAYYALAFITKASFFCEAVITQLLVSCDNEEFDDGDLGKQTRLIVW